MTQSSTQEEKNKTDNKRLWIMILILLLLLIVVSCFCVYQTDILERWGINLPFNSGNNQISHQEEEISISTDQGYQDASDDQDSDLGSDSGDDGTSEAADQEYVIADFDPEDLYFLPDWQDSMAVEAEFHSAGLLANGDMLISFYTGEAMLPPGAYVATVDSDTGKSASFHCELIASLDGYVQCYGPKFRAGTGLKAELYYTPPDFTLDGKIKDALLEGTVNLTPEYEDLDDVAELLGILGTIDNPFEAWTVVGCCVKNSDEDGVPAGCEDLVVYNDGQSFAFFDQGGTDEDPEDIWQGMMDEYHAPQEWKGEGDLMSAENLQKTSDLANACAEAYGYTGDGEIDSWMEARIIFTLVNAFDPRSDSGEYGFWDSVNDALHAIGDVIGGTFEFLFTGDGDFGSVGETLGQFWDNSFGALLSTFVESICLSVEGISGEDPGEALGYCEEFAENTTGSKSIWHMGDSDNSDADLLTPLTEFPQACKDYIDYAKNNTYFPWSGFVGTNPNVIGEYCTDALGLDLNDFMEREDDSWYSFVSPDLIYDVVIDTYGYTGNPAIPDPCREIVQWCDSDQIEAVEALGRPVVEGSYEHPFWGINGCNDPANFAEVEDWTNNSEAPVCPSEDTLMLLSDLLDPLPGSNPIMNSYCYEVNVFENSPIYGVAQCASDLDWNQELLSAGDYLDFLMYLAALQPLVDFQIGDITAACGTAMDWANWFGFGQQAMNAGAGACAVDGPTQFNTGSVQWVMPLLKEQPSAGGGSGAGAGAPGGGGSCSPPPGGCPTGSVSSGGLTQGYFNTNTCQCEMCPFGKVWNGAACVRP